MERGQVRIEEEEREELERATLTKTSSRVVSAMPQAWTEMRDLADSTARKTSEMRTSFLGSSNRWVPEMW